MDRPRPSDRDPVGNFLIPKDSPVDLVPGNFGPLPTSLGLDDPHEVHAVGLPTGMDDFLVHQWLVSHIAVGGTSDFH